MSGIRIWFECKIYAVSERSDSQAKFHTLPEYTCVYTNGIHQRHKPEVA